MKELYKELWIRYLDYGDTIEKEMPDDPYEMLIKTSEVKNETRTRND